MKLAVIAVGTPGKRLAPAIEEYERRAERYWKLETTEVKVERAGRGTGPEEVRAKESDRLLSQVPDRLETIVLTRGGKRWSSVGLARYLERLAVRGQPGAAFLIGGAFGVSPEITRGARRRLSLSPMTLPHDLARLVLAEQLYRAGTIVRREPYHKGGR